VTRTTRTAGALLACILLVGLHPGLARAEEQSTGSAAGWGALSALTSLVYAPVKVVYAIGGCVVGGFAWVFSAGDNDVAKTVVTPAVRGDYVVTPQHLRGERPLEFIGREPEPGYQ
jgi:type IV secretory pathway VirB2 component (pilin)